MCFSSDQRPPLPPRSSEVGDHGSVVLTAADGNRFAAYDAVPVTRRGASLVLLPDIRGMHAFYTDLALGFATAGIDTVALDPFGRTAGLTARDDDFDYLPHAKALEPGQVLADARAAAARLRERSDDPVFTLGFCMFGGHSWRLASTDLGAAGCMGFYGRPSTAADVVDQMPAPCCCSWPATTGDLAAGERRLRPGAHRRGQGAQDGDLRRGAALVLRPQLRAVGAGLRRRLAGDARLRRRLPLRPPPRARRGGAGTGAGLRRGCSPTAGWARAPCRRSRGARRGRMPGSRARPSCVRRGG